MSTEDRLRAALAAKADSVTDDQLRAKPIVAGQEVPAEPAIEDLTVADPTIHTVTFARIDDTPEPRSLRSARWFAPVLAAAAVVAIAVGAVTISAVHRADRTPVAPATNGTSTNAGPAPSASSSVSSKPSTGSSSTRSTPTSTKAALLPLGKEGQRSDIPWNQVGPGWTLAQWGTNLARSIHPDHPNLVLYLVDPLGGRYRITALSDSYQLSQWSPDGRRALFTYSSAEGSVDKLVELDLTTGAITHSFSTPGTPLTYTRPTGKAVLLEAGSGGPDVEISKVGLNGQLQATFPSTTATTGRIRSIGALYAPDGLHVLLSAANGAVWVDNSGHVTQAFRSPTGSTSCEALSWWDTDLALLSCWSGQRLQLWTLSTATGTWTQLVTDRAGIDAWGDDNNVILQTTARDCRSAFARLVVGTTTSVPILIAPAQDHLLDGLSLDNGQLILAGGSCNGDTSALYFYSVSTGAVTTVLGGSANGGNLQYAVAFPKD